MGKLTARYHDLEFRSALPVAENLFQSLGHSFLVSGLSKLPSSSLEHLLLGALVEEYAPGHTGQIVLGDVSLL